MAEDEVLQKLMGAEREAKEMIADAQAQANEAVEERRRRCREEEQGRFASLAKELEEEGRAQLAAIDSNFNQQIQAYRQALADRALDTEGLKKLAVDYLEKGM